MGDPIRPTKQLYSFVLSKGLTDIKDYDQWATKYSGDEGLAKVHSAMEQLNLKPGDIKAFRSTAYEAYEPVKKKEPSGPESSTGSPPADAKTAEPPSDDQAVPVAGSPVQQGPLVTGATPFDTPQAVLRPPTKIFNDTKTKFALDDILIAAAEKGDQPLVGNLDKGAMASFQLHAPITERKQITGSENFLQDAIVGEIQGRGERFIGEVGGMGPDKVSAFRVNAAKSYATKASEVVDQSFANLDVKYDGFSKRFQEDMRSLSELETSEKKAEQSNDTAMADLIRKEREKILQHYKKYSNDPDFQLLSNSQKALGRAQETVEQELAQIKERNGEKEALRAQSQTATDLLADSPWVPQSKYIVATNNWVGRKFTDLLSNVLSVADMAVPTDPIQSSALIKLADGIKEFGELTWPTPSQVDQRVFEDQPEGFKEMFKGVEVAETKYKGQQVDVIYSGGKPVHVRSKTGRLLETLDEEQAKQFEGLPTQRSTNTTQGMINTVSIFADMCVDIGLGGRGIRALSLGRKVDRAGGMAGIIASIYDDTYRAYRQEGIPHTEAKLASLGTAGAIGSVEWFVGPVEKYLGGNLSAYSQAVRKSTVKQVAKGGLSATELTSRFLGNYAKMVTTEIAEETVLEPFAQRMVQYAFKTATGDGRFYEDYTMTEARDNFVYSVPISMMLAPGMAAQEMNVTAGAAYLKTINDVEQTSKYISDLMVDGTITQDEAKTLEKNLKEARVMMGTLRDDLTPEEKEDAARLIYIAQLETKNAKEAGSVIGKEVLEARVNEAKKALSEYYRPEDKAAFDKANAKEEKDKAKKAAYEQKKAEKTPPAEAPAEQPRPANEPPPEKTPEEIAERKRSKRFVDHNGHSFPIEDRPAKVGDLVDYDGVIGTLVNEDDFYYVVDEKGEMTFVEGGQASLSPLKVLDDSGAPINRAEDIDSSDLSVTVDGDVLHANGRQYTIGGLNYDNDGNAVSVSVTDADGKTKTIRNEAAVMQIEAAVIYDQLKPQENEITEAAKELGVEPVKAIQPERQVGNTQENQKQAEPAVAQPKEQKAEKVAEPVEQTEPVKPEVKSKLKREDLPESQSNTRTPITQKLLDYFADVQNIPRFKGELADGKYISWLQEASNLGYKVAGLLNSPREAFDLISEAEPVKPEVKSVPTDAANEAVTDAANEAVTDAANEAVTDAATEMTSEQAVEEIKSKKLNRAEGLNMGANQALGTFVSTEKKNRYSDKAEPVEVEVKKPFVSTDDPGLTGMREQVVKDNLDQFTPEDFVDDDGMRVETIPENPTIDNLTESGNRKAAELVTKTLQEQGYDSIYFPESNVQEGELVVFDRKAVKKPAAAEPTTTETKRPEKTKEQKALELRRKQRDAPGKMYRDTADKFEGDPNPSVRARVKLLGKPILSLDSIRKEVGHDGKVTLPDGRVTNQWWGLYKAKEKGGISVEQLAEEMWEEADTDMYTSQDYRNALIEELAAYKGRAEVAASLEGETMDAQMKEEMERMEEAHREIAEETGYDAETIYRAEDAVDGVSEGFWPSVSDEAGNLDQDALAGLTENEIGPAAFRELEKIRLMEETGLDESIIEDILHDVETNTEPTEYIYGKDYETATEIFNRLRGEKEARDAYGDDYLPKEEWPPYQGEASIEGVLESPQLQAYAGQRKRENNKKKNELLEKIRKQLNDGSLGLAMDPIEQARKNQALAKNLFHLAYLYIEDGIIDVADFAKRIGQQVSPMMEKIFQSAKDIKDLSTAPLFFREDYDFESNFRVNFQDSNFALLDFMRQLEKQGAEITPEMNAYMKAELQKSKARAAVEKMEVFMYGKPKGLMGSRTTTKNSLLGRMKQDKLTKDNLNEWMVAEHAPERNARGVEETTKRVNKEIAKQLAIIANENSKPKPNTRLINGAMTKIDDIRNGRSKDFKVVTNAAHITDAEAQAIKDKYTPEQQEKLKKYAKEFRDNVIKPRIELQHDSGLISQEQKDALLGGTRKGSSVVFEHYVPMVVNDQMLEPGEFHATTYATLPTRKKGIFGKKGGSDVKSLTFTDKYSWKEGHMHNVVEMGMVQFAKAMNQIERNRTTNALYDLVESIQSRVGTQSQAFSGRSSMRIDANGEVIDTKERTPQDILDNSVATYRDGVAHYVYFAPHRNKDGNMETHPIVQMFNQDRGKKTPNWAVDMLFKASRMYLNFHRNMITTYNIGFGPVNFLSDIQDAIVNISDVKAEYKLPAFSSMVRGKMLANLLPSARVLATKQRWDFGELPTDLKDYKTKHYWQEAVEHGMPISFSQYATLDEAIKDYSKRMDRIYTGDGKWAVTKNTLATTFGYINDIFENQTRLATYKALRDSGLTADQAAQAAKNISLNFEKKGLMMGSLNTWYMFLNAGVQGTARTLKNVKNIKRTWPVYAARAAYIASTRMMAAYLHAGPGDDERMQKYFNAVSDSWRSANYNYYPGPNGEIITIRKPYSMLRLWDTFIESIVDYNIGAITPGDVHLRLLTSMQSVFDPVGGGSTQPAAYAPTILRVPIELWMNEDYTGRNIVSFLDPTRPVYTQFKDDDGTTAFAISSLASRFIAGQTGAQFTGNIKKDYVTPDWDVSPDQLRYLAGALVPGLPIELARSAGAINDAIKNEEPIDPAKLILLRRFWRPKDQKSADMSLVYGAINNPRTTVFGAFEKTDTPMQKKYVLEAFKRLQEDTTIEKGTRSRMKSKLKSHYPDWF